MTSDFISLIANLALALSVIVALIFGIAQVRAAARDRLERLTLETLRNFQTREFAELINFITTYDFPADMKLMRKMPVEEQVMLIQFAQEMEMLGILVAEKHINLDLVDKTIGSLVTTAWDKYKTMFLDMRVNLPDPFLGEYFQWLSDQIDERLTKNPRIPFHEAKQ